jgi:hypothetical protein
VRSRLHRILGTVTFMAARIFGSRQQRQPRLAQRLLGQMGHPLEPGSRVTEQQIDECCVPFDRSTWRRIPLEIQIGRPSLHIETSL